MAKRSFSYPSDVKEPFWRQRQNARRRGIKWELTYDQWYQIWQQSGLFDQRGRKGNQYCMARKGDKGPYSATNVQIITQTENVRQAHCGVPRTVQTKARIKKANLKNAHAARARAKARPRLPDGKWLSERVAFNG